MADGDGVVRVRRSGMALPHPALPVAVGFAILAGHPQTAMYLLYATLAYAAWRAWPWRARGRRLWTRLGLGFLLGVGLSAAGWAPALEFIRCPLVPQIEEYAFA